jgi:AraC family transcriptional regulator
VRYVIEVRDLEARPTAAVRAEIAPEDLGPVLSEVLPEVWEHLARYGARPAGPPFTRYYEYEDDRIDLEAGFPVAGAVPPLGRIELGELPAGEAAIVWHEGPYEGLTAAHEAVLAWIDEHGREPAGAPWEVYWTDPGEVPDPSAWRTEVVWPLA